MRHRFRPAPRALSLLALAALLFSMPAGAAEPNLAFDLQQFKPGTGASDVLAVESASLPQAGSWHTSFGLHYAHSPLRLANPDDGSTVLTLVGHQMAMDLGIAFVPHERFEIGLAIPIMLHQGQGDASGALAPPTLSGSGFGDLRLLPKFVALKGAGFAVGVGLPISVPTGLSEGYAGRNGPTARPRILGDYSVAGRVRLVGNLGVAVRGEERFANLVQSSAFDYGLGAEAPFGFEGLRFAAIGNLFGEVGFGANDPSARPLELLLGVKWFAPNGLTVTAGAGPGLSQGAGTPAFRAFAAAGWSIDRLPDLSKLLDRDPDGDGRPNSVDRCPEQAEDLDGFEDEDGCPDPDNDGDRMADGADKCPLAAEDSDGFEDEDGCPDPDDDGDGILDSADRCPREAEDPDGFEDEDGCPDLDHDRDGILDVDDKCPLAAEDADDFEDADGCPDPDNDGDGVLDAEDKCPLAAEDPDGFEDGDGCPDPDNDRDGILDAVDQCPLEAEVINGFKDEDGCPDKGESKVVMDAESKKIVILDRVYFASGKAVILKRSFNVLDQVAATLKANPGVRRLQVEGHTDAAGNDAANLELSQRRAESVVRFLAERGIESARLVAKGFGETVPLKDNKTAAGRADNRRVEFTILDTE